MKKIENVHDFSLKHTLECGQVFRWKQDADGGYWGVVNHAIFRVRQQGQDLLFKTGPHRLKKQFVKKYFGLTHNLEEIYSGFSGDEHLYNAISKFRGLRLIEQDHWECLASYILSSANNIARISLIIEETSKHLGDEIVFDGLKSWSFPTPQRVAKASLKDLLACGMGFRAKYFKNAARKLVNGNLDLSGLKKKRYEDAKRILMELDGVGEKIADCVLLFSFGKSEAFPIDVWVKRAMEKFYFSGNTVREKTIREYARRHFGKQAGYAQQYLYHLIRI